MKGIKRAKLNKTQRLILVALAALTLCFASMATRLLLQLRLDRQRDQERQVALLDSIRDGDGAIRLDKKEITGAVNFYRDGPAAPEEEAALLGGTASVDVGLDGGLVVQGIGVLSIDRIGLELPVTDGVSAEQLKVAVGHVPGTASIGHPGNAVIAGHRSYAYGEHFNRLGELEPGDEIRYQCLAGRSATFVVEDILVVDPGDPVALEQPEDRVMLTLYTCTPIETATHRLLIRALRTDQ